MEIDKRGSIGQTRVFLLVKKIFPQYKTIWEQPIKPINCRFDIFIKEIGLAIEVDGVQHDTYNSFFYKDESEAKRAYIKDEAKNDFCETNGIKLIRLKYKEALNIDKDQLQSIINSIDYPKSEYTYSCLN